MWGLLDLWDLAKQDPGFVNATTNLGKVADLAGSVYLAPLYLVVFLVLGRAAWPLVHFCTDLGIWGLSFCLLAKPDPSRESEWTRLALVSTLQGLDALLPGLTPARRVSSLVWKFDGLRGVLLAMKTHASFVDRIDSLQVRYITVGILGRNRPVYQIMAWSGLVVPLFYDRIRLVRCVQQCILAFLLHQIAVLPTVTPALLFISANLALISLVPFVFGLCLSFFPSPEVKEVKEKKEAKRKGVLRKRRVKKPAPPPLQLLKPKPAPASKSWLLFKAAVSLFVAAFLLPVLALHPILLVFLCDVAINGGESRRGGGDEMEGPLGKLWHATICFSVFVANFAVWWNSVQLAPTARSAVQSAVNLTNTSLSGFAGLTNAFFSF